MTWDDTAGTARRGECNDGEARTSSAMRCLVPSTCTGVRRGSLKTFRHEICSRNSPRKLTVDREDINNLYLNNLT